MRKMFLLIAAVLMAIGVSAQANLNDYQAQKDVRYAGDTHTGHKLDIYYPNDEQTKHPVIIHIYGSAWASNTLKGSADLTTVGIAALEAGYIFVAPNHRSSSDALFPAQLNDIKAVVRYLRGNAETLGVDTSFIAISGFNSGGHLAALMGVTKGIKEYTVGAETMNIEGDVGNYTNQSSSIDAVCAWAGVVELRNQASCDIPNILSSSMEALIGISYASKPDRWALACANTYVNAKNAPVILFHGSADAIYPACMSENFYNNLNNAGVDCEYYLHSGGHGVNKDYTDEMITFFDRIKAAKAATSALDDISIDTKAAKRLVDGHLLIDRNGKSYTAHGAELR